MDNRPIGIFDSGIGGLTVANSICKELPNESIVYFGDTKHLPYGEKSNKSIQEFSKNIVDFLVYKKCKAIIIACNSASAIATNIIRKRLLKIPIYNVIDPVINKVTKNYSYKNIGIIGTKATIKSKIYEKKILKLSPKIKVKSLATPLLAPMIEEQFINQEISHQVIKNYLSNNLLNGIDALILACTHYPLIHKEIISFYKQKVDVINPTRIIAKNIAQNLLKSKILSNSKSNRYQFFISNYTTEFEKSAKFFFKEDITLKEKDISNTKMNI